MSHTNQFLGSVMMVAGTSIGAGMLALPVSTGVYGFTPSILLFVVCWLFMLVTGLLILEVNLWFKPGANMTSMAAQTLGFGGKVIAWVTYLLLFYSLLAAYASGMGDLIRQGWVSVFAGEIHNSMGSLLFIALTAVAIYFGTRAVDYVNRVFFICKLLAFVAVIFLLLPKVEFPRLGGFSPNKMWLSLTIVVTSFGFHNIIPSIRVYLQDNVKKIRQAIVIGSALPLLVYIVWQIAIVGVVPLEGKEGLTAILSSGQPATGLALALNQLMTTSWIASLFNLFTICAITTSFICVAFSLFDFLIDSFGIKRTPGGRFSTLLLTFLPPLIFVFFYPNGFIMALSYAGIFVAILLGMLPALMSWSGRYCRQHLSETAVYRPKAGKVGLVLVILFSLLIVFSELVGR